MDIGHSIRKARLKRGLSQRGLAKLIGVSGGAIAQWEGGGATIKKPKVENLILASQVLQLPMSELLEDAPEGDAFVLASPQEIALVTLFRLFTPQQREVHLSLFYSSAGISEPSQENSNPGDRRRV